MYVKQGQRFKNNLVYAIRVSQPEYNQMSFLKMEYLLYNILYFGIFISNLLVILKFF